VADVVSRIWPIVSVGLRSTALIGVALFLILVLLPAVFGAAGTGAPIGG
jgi:hypothetical protein